jgi:glyoxylase-like metal-dependent hydrolase (beta-lactamase superfamily II)
MDKSMVTYRLDFGQLATLMGYVWYIEGPKDKILVDAGVSCEYLSKRRGIPAMERQSLDSGLQEVGLTPRDIDLVIITHLHSDHVAEAHKFSKAKFLIQKKEFEFACQPHPTVAAQYPSEFFEGLNFETLSGDMDICDGLSVLSTPGHTPGGQSVSISTPKGTAIISGICSCRENFEPPKPFSEGMPVYPFGIFVNLFEMYDSLLRIKEKADIIIPIHDPEYMHIERIP